ncbi:hypothetical protein M2324_002468 [Rhodovulum sulfidophilum]|uniref:hypothetical protein n=1 Tax=Rhodovulum sulfidophilum TaxID=35806 RepID=UPI0005A6E6E5|nr:hypothetical protein [Rhodovulum sulfidophilum]ANB33829.1 hypothetical protein A6W98_06895 [Rhodovulum sulfidophilum DSM 1374]ANB37651.1 hypothetical protein A6024_06750 [Rhodovulum sulfidophilum]MCW2304063.1 hypothetical protein [Rhodovulum sulfidophilum]
MTPDRGSRGAAPVATLDELPPLERAAIRCLRGWSDGPMTRARMRRNFGQILGPRAEAQEELLDALTDLVRGGGRRPMASHRPAHREVGGDENAFAQMVAAALGGEREDAFLFALALLGPHAASQAVAIAEELGFALLGLVRAHPANAHVSSPVLH